MNIDTILNELLGLSHELGIEDRHLAILGEGNLSADNGDGTFWVKASGSNMATITPQGFSRIRFEVVMDIVDMENPSEQQIVAGLKESLVNKNM